MKRNILRFSLSLVLCLMIAVTMMPLNVFAEDSEATSAVVEQSSAVETADAVGDVDETPEIPSPILDYMIKGQETISIYVDNEDDFYDFDDVTFDYTLIESASGEETTYNTYKAQYTFRDVDMFQTYRVGVRAVVEDYGDIYYGNWSYLTIKKSYWEEYIKPEVRVSSTKVTPGTLKLNATKPKSSSYSIYPVRYQFAVRKSGSSTWKTAKSTGNSYSFKNLTNGKTYNYKVRGYTVINGTTSYGEWSTTKSVKVGIPVSYLKIKGVTNKVYTGKYIGVKVTATYKGKAATIKYTKTKHKNVGRYKVKITGTGKYIGTKTLAYKIIPKKTKITTLKNIFYCNDEYYDGFYFHKAVIKYKKAGSGISGYEIAIKPKNGKWKILGTTTKTEKTISSSAVGEKIYQIKVRAYKELSNGSRINGKWSNPQRFTTKYRDLNFNAMYYNQSYLKGWATNVIKGEQIVVKVDGKKYTKTIKKDASKIKFSIYIGRHDYGKKINVGIVQPLYKSKYSFWRYDIIWYAKAVKVGMTQKQVRCTWGDPSDTSTASGGWAFWYWDDGSYVHFKNGRVYSWYDAAG